MELYASVLNFAIPFFLVLMIIEYVVGNRRGQQVIRSFDTISSLSSGLTNAWKDVLGLTVVIISYQWLYDHIAMWHIEDQLWMYVIAFIGLDFAGYWSHRFEHRINILWNRHIIHHSSEEFNLACALRQPISTIFGLFFFLLIPTALLGVSPKIVSIVAPLHLFAQFWYHTTLINRMGWLEQIIVTPSHHRVHHAINAEYLDKNFSQVFIIWDKLFGTYQEEKDEIAPVYGVKRSVKTWNPFLINVQHFVLMFTDAIRTKHISDKIKIWFMPTGWRPIDVEKDSPVDYTNNASDQVKYQTPNSLLKQVWSWFQLLFTLLLTGYLFNTIGDQTFAHMLLYGLFVMLTIFSYTSVMDDSKIALPVELLKVVVGCMAIYMLGDWFGLDQMIKGGTLIISVYLILSLSMTLYFSKDAYKANLSGVERNVPS